MRIGQVRPSIQVDHASSTDFLGAVDRAVNLLGSKLGIILMTLCLKRGKSRFEIALVYPTYDGLSAVFHYCEFLKAAKYHVQVMNQALEGLDCSKIRMHVCWGNSPAPHDVALADIAALVLSAKPRFISFEACNPGHAHEHEVWKTVKVPADKVLMPGVLDTTTAHVEHHRLVTQRLQAYAMSGDCVMACTDCGFADPKLKDVAYSKMASMAKGAAALAAEPYAVARCKDMALDVALSAASPGEPSTMVLGRLANLREPMIPGSYGYTMNYTTALGKGSALQRRSNVAIFVPLDGPYEFAYGSKGQHKAMDRGKQGVRAEHDHFDLVAEPVCCFPGDHGRRVRTALFVLVALLAVLCLRSLPGFCLVEEGEHEPNHAMSSQIKFAHGALTHSGVTLLRTEFHMGGLPDYHTKKHEPVAGKHIFDERLQGNTLGMAINEVEDTSIGDMPNEHYGQSQDSGYGIPPHLNDPGMVPPGHDQPEVEHALALDHPSGGGMQVMKLVMGISIMQHFVSGNLPDMFQTPDNTNGTTADAKNGIDNRLHMPSMIWILILLLPMGVMALALTSGFRPRWHNGNPAGDSTHAGAATLKVPPTWCVERNGSWLSDLVLWASATDMEQQRQGPVAALQITGAAREIIREIPPATLRDGVNDNLGNHVEVLILILGSLKNNQHRATGPGLAGAEATRSSGNDLDYQCRTCGTYFDEEFSSGTDTDVELDEEELKYYKTVEVDGQSRTDVDAVQGELYHDYMMAKQRWLILLAGGHIREQEVEPRPMAEGLAIDLDDTQSISNALYKCVFRRERSLIVIHEDQLRQRAVDGISSLILGITSQQPKAKSFPGFGGKGHFPWWEVENEIPGQVGDRQGTYHLKTRLDGNRVGLLVDPGAHDNLIGSRTLEKLTLQVGPHRERPLTRKLTIEGVGRGAQEATIAAQVPIWMTDEQGGELHGSFNAPVVPDSELPPLLGLRSLMAKSAVLDMGTERLIIPGDGGLRVQASPGTIVLPLQVSESGHLILEVDTWMQFPDEESRVPPDDLVFTMGCRQTRDERSLSGKVDKSPVGGKLHWCSENASTSTLAEVLSFWPGSLATAKASDKQHYKLLEYALCISITIFIHVVTVSIFCERYKHNNHNSFGYGWPDHVWEAEPGMELETGASALQRLNVTRHHFCNYQSLTEREALPCKAVILLYSNCNLPSVDGCHCGQSQQHYNLKELNKTQQHNVEQEVVHGIVKGCAKHLVATGALAQNEEAIRQKDKKKAGHVAVRRKILAERHDDDCGENLSGLGKSDL
ncbi:unnamed protein product [Effrenium voratum]|nr:unnamed protein product [Effrenium voratum]